MTGFLPSRFFILLLAVLTLHACGGDDSDTPASINTLAYVVTECRQDASGIFWHQELRVQQGEASPVRIAETPQAGPLPAGTFDCELLGGTRSGLISVIGGAFQRVGVSPDGSAVVFEVTDDFSLLARDGLVSSEQEGIFFVRADGSGLRRVGAPSRQASYVLLVDPSSPLGLRTTFFPFFGFSPGGHTVLFNDRGPGPDGQDAVQVTALNVSTGDRAQVTRLPLALADISVNPYALPAVAFPIFFDEHTIAFLSFSNPEGLNPDGEVRVFLTNADGSGLRTVPMPIAIPGAELNPTYAITGSRREVTALLLPGIPANLVHYFDQISEIFLFDGPNLLQLTNFHRVDTLWAFLSRDRTRVFFFGSGDPFGTNPTENCQIFSVDVTGANLKQITNFREGQQNLSQIGCLPPGTPPGCFASPLNLLSGTSQDSSTGAILFNSSCNPFGTNPRGAAIFAVNPDGTGLRQLTNTRGIVRAADGNDLLVEFPGPYAFGPYR